MTTLPDYTNFEKRIGITFDDKQLLQHAFTHRSFLNERAGRDMQHNERLEFLGDAVLELIVTRFLFETFPDKPEGEMTSYRAALVNTVSLARVATTLGMDDYLLLSKGERMDTEKGRGHILANTFEAFLGALYLDQGYDAAQAFVAQHLFAYLDQVLAEGLHRDAKSYFQEQAQEHVRVTPRYEVVSSEGPDHDREFIMAVYLEDEYVAEGAGPSKKKAETAAAQKALQVKGWN